MCIGKGVWTNSEASFEPHQRIGRSLEEFYVTISAWGFNRLQEALGRIQYQHIHAALQQDKISATHAVGKRKTQCLGQPL